MRKNCYLVALIALGCVLPGMSAGSTYTGSDTACFYSRSQSNCTLTSQTSGIGIDTAGKAFLTFTPKSSFSARGVTGRITVNLGTFTVAKTLAGAEAGTFDLNVSFSVPIGAGQKSYSAFTIGGVVLGAGGAEIAFNQPTSQAFNGFELSVPSQYIEIDPGHSYELDGTITPVPVAEPEALTLLAGAMSVLAMLRLAHWDSLLDGWFFGARRH